MRSLLLAVAIFAAAPALAQITPGLRPHDHSTVGTGGSSLNPVTLSGVTVGGTTGTGNIVFSASPTLTGTLTGAAANFSGKVGTTGGSFAAPGSDGQGFIYSNSGTYGLIAYGRGSSYDFAVLNKTGVDVLEVPTGTTNVNVVGNLNTGGNVYLQSAAGAPTAFIGSAASMQLFAGGAGTPYKGIVIGDATGYDFSLGSVAAGAYTKRFTVTDTGTATLTKSAAGDVFLFSNAGATPQTGYLYSDAVQVALFNGAAMAGEGVRLDAQTHLVRLYASSNEVLRAQNGTGRYLIVNGSAAGNPTIDVSAGGLTITPATTLSGALTYGGVTLSNAATGTGNMVLSASPALTGTPTAPTASIGTSTTQLASTAYVATFHSQITNALGADVALNNTTLFFDGPSTAQGTSGTWFASGTVSFLGPAGSQLFCKLWDGTTVIAATSTPAGTTASAALSGVITSPAANIRISCKDNINTTGNLKFNVTGTSKDSVLTVQRIQ